MENIYIHIYIHTHIGLAIFFIFKLAKTTQTIIQIFFYKFFDKSQTIIQLLDLWSRRNNQYGLFQFMFRTEYH